MATKVAHYQEKKNSEFEPNMFYFCS